MIYNETNDLLQNINPNKLNVGVEDGIDEFLVIKENNIVNFNFDIQKDEQIIKNLYDKVKTILDKNTVKTKNKIKKIKNYNRVSILVYLIILKQNQINNKLSYYYRSQLFKKIKNKIIDYKKNSYKIIKLEYIYSVLIFYLINKEIIVDKNFDIFIYPSISFFKKNNLKSYFKNEIKKLQNKKNINTNSIVKNIILRFNKNYLEKIIQELKENNNIKVFANDFDIFKEELKMISQIFHLINN